MRGDPIAAWCRRSACRPTAHVKRCTRGRKQALTGVDRSPASACHTAAGKLTMTTRNCCRMPGHRQPERDDRRPARPAVLLQDVWLLEKLAHFDREVIPERRMHAKGSAPTAPSPSPTTSRATPAPRIFSRSARRPSSSPASRPSPASAAQPTPSATSVVSRSSSTPRKATGTWWATTRRSSSCATRSSSPTSTTRSSAIRAPTCAAPGTTGISGRCCRSAAPGDHRHERPRHPGQLPPHARLRLAHLQLHQRQPTSATGSSSTSAPSRASRT
jgi:hypothetical protein